MKQYEALKHGTDDFPVGIHDTLCESGFSLYPHIHREFEFLVMVEGKGTVYIEEEKYELKKGEGIFINSKQLHIGIKTDSERAMFYAIVFAPEIFGNFVTDTVVQKYVDPVIDGRVRIKPELGKEVLSLLDEIHDNKESELKIKACLFEIWDICFKNAEKQKKPEKSKPVDEIKKVMEYIRKRSDEDITLDEIAESVNLSKAYLCRQFSSIVHMTPFEYVIQVRIDNSCNMLKTTDLSVGEIAQKCGFNSSSYFSKMFREKKGCSPREYRMKKV